MKFKTIIGTVKLTSERKTHIIQHHPIMDLYLVHLKEVFERPDDIRFSSHSDDILLFYHFFDKIEGGKYITAVVNKAERQVKTAYLTNRIKIGRKYEQE